MPNPAKIMGEGHCGRDMRLSRGIMQDDAEERRAQDKRDLEFFRSRVRPTCSDLWRLAEKPSKFNGIHSGSGSDEMVWPLLASVVAFLLLAWAGMIDRVASILL